MQDTIQSLVARCFQDYKQFIFSIVPEAIEFEESVSAVRNIFNDEQRSFALASGGNRKADPQPLFLIYLIKNPHENVFMYNVKPESYLAMVTQVLEKSL